MPLIAAQADLAVLERSNSKQMSALLKDSEVVSNSNKSTKKRLMKFIRRFFEMMMRQNFFNLKPIR